MLVKSCLTCVNFEDASCCTNMMSQRTGVHDAGRDIPLTKTLAHVRAWLCVVEVKKNHGEIYTYGVPRSVLSYPAGAGAYNNMNCLKDMRRRHIGHCQHDSPVD